MTERIFILACSWRKCPAAGLLPAYERYDGPAWRVVRKAHNEGLVSYNDVWAISAMYGLIPARTPIAHYDLIMNEAQRRLLRPQIQDAWQGLMFNAPTDIYLVMGKNYKRALPGAVLPTVGHRRSTNFHFAEGGIGMKMQQLRAWLEGA